MTDINARIAVKKGWKIQDVGIGSTPLLEAISPQGQYRAYPEELPQYTTDWRLAGGLLESMQTDRDWHLHKPNSDKWEVSMDYLDDKVGGWIHRAFVADTPQMAICLAFLEWSEG